MDSIFCHDIIEELAEALLGAQNFVQEAGTSRSKEKVSSGSSAMDIEYSDDSDYDSNNVMQGLDEAFLRGLVKKAAISFFDQHGLINHQISSYNEFIKHGIQRVFDSIGEIVIEPEHDPSKRGDGEGRRASLRFGKVTLHRPVLWTGGSSADAANEYVILYPRRARLQNMTYGSKIRVQTHLQVYSEGLSRSDKFKTGVDRFVEKTILSEYHTEVTFGNLPVMVKSDLCWMGDQEERDCEFDEGGYFIIKGAEKVFIAQEQICLSRLWVSNDPTWTISYRPERRRKRVHVKLIPKVKNLMGGKKILTVFFAATDVPIWLMFFALGVPNDREVINLIGADITDSEISTILIESIYNADTDYEGFRKEGNATDHIKSLMQGCKFPPTESVEECIRKYLFPNLTSRGQKARFLAYMVKCLIEAYKGHRKVDDRDDLRNKRLELAGELLERELFIHIKHAERRMIKLMQRDLNRGREMLPASEYLDASIITNGLSRAFSTGAWSHPYRRMERISGIVATLRRTNPLQTIADMRKTRQYVSYTGRAGDARYPHPSHWGRLCFLSTPDGENCGLVKNLASMGLVSTTIVEREDIVKTLCRCGMERLNDDTLPLLNEKDKIFLDGEWVGVCKDSASLVSKLRLKRRGSEVHHQIEIKRDRHHGEVRIFADAGRILRPLLVVQNLHKIKDLKGDFSFQTLMDKGIMELIGPEEEEDCQTAWGIRCLYTAQLETPLVTYTHCELDSSFLLGLSCGIVPFTNHDHARRILYQSEKHSQQAIGYPVTNSIMRVDTSAHQLSYPQRPLIRTMLSDCLGKSKFDHHKGMIPHPEFYNGQCAIVAVNVHLGYNQEDSLVMNRSSLERGMFRTKHIRSYKTEVDNKESSDKKVKSDNMINFVKMPSKIGRVDSLNEDGFPYVGASLQTGDIIMGKHSATGVDHSIRLKHTEKGMVEKVILSANDEGKNFAVVSLRQFRSPVLGDKFSSMHGQKGVLSFLDSQENFPFTKQGIVPDIVINPHAFPSRQTPGQLLEAALGKGVALGGEIKYATPFATPSVEAITAQLHRLGFCKWGTERVYDGRTGEKVDSLIFMGPTFYQRLIHMAEDKVKYRNTGPVHPLTHQPVADRKLFGGIKFGEMERDCLIAHGAAANLHERLFTLSDPAEMHVCRKCKNMANVIQRRITGDGKIRGPYCRFCKSAEEIVKVNVPHGAKLLTQELFSMGISLKFDAELC